MSQIERIRTICLALPEATEKTAWGAPTFRVRDKMFAIFQDNHHNDGRIALWCNAPQGEQEMVLQMDSQKFFKPPYMGPRGWIALHLNVASDEDVAYYAKQAYKCIAPKKLIEQLDE